MIEITKGTTEERLIRILQRIYPITVEDLKKELKLSEDIVIRTLKQLQIKGIVQLEPLPEKTYIRLLRQDFNFIGKKRQRKFIKHHSGKKKQEKEEYNGIMYS